MPHFCMMGRTKSFVETLKEAHCFSYAWQILDFSNENLVVDTYQTAFVLSIFILSSVVVCNGIIRTV